MNISKQLWIIAFTLFALTGGAFATEAAEDHLSHEMHHDDHSDDVHAESEHRQHDAHVHGAALMNLIIEKNTIQIELETPVMNVLGFEYAPRDDAQQKSLDTALASMQNINQVITFNDAKCTVNSAKVVNPFSDNVEQEHDVDHAKHNTHDDHNDKKAKQHFEFQANYELSCKKFPEKLHANIVLFKTFTGFKEIKVQWINNEQQGVAEVKPNNTMVYFYESL